MRTLNGHLGTQGSLGGLACDQGQEAKEELGGLELGAGVRRGMMILQTCSWSMNVLSCWRGGAARIVSTVQCTGSAYSLSKALVKATSQYTKVEDTPTILPFIPAPQKT